MSPITKLEHPEWKPLQHRIHKKVKDPFSFTMRTSPVACHADTKEISRSLSTLEFAVEFAMHLSTGQTSLGYQSSF